MNMDFPPPPPPPKRSGLAALLHGIGAMFGLLAPTFLLFAGIALGIASVYLLAISGLL